MHDERRYVALSTCGRQKPKPLAPYVRIMLGLLAVLVLGMHLLGQPIREHEHVASELHRVSDGTSGATSDGPAGPGTDGGSQHEGHGDAAAHDDGSCEAGPSAADAAMYVLSAPTRGCLWRISPLDVQTVGLLTSRTPQSPHPVCELSVHRV